MHKVFLWVKNGILNISFVGLLASIWMVGTYINEKYWSKVLQKEILSISAKSNFIKIRETLVGIEVEITYTNNGDEPVFNALNGVSIYGFNVRAAEDRESSEHFGARIVGELNRGNKASTYSFSRQGMISKGSLLAFSAPLVPAHEFQPKQTSSFKKYFVIKDEWDYVEARIEVLHTSKPLAESPKYEFRENDRIGLNTKYAGRSDLRRSYVEISIPIRSR